MVGFMVLPESGSSAARHRFVLGTERSRERPGAFHERTRSLTLARRTGRLPSGKERSRAASPCLRESLRLPDRGLSLRFQGREVSPGTVLFPRIPTRLAPGLLVPPNRAGHRSVRGCQTPSLANDNNLFTPAARTFDEAASGERWACFLVTSREREGSSGYLVFRRRDGDAGDRGRRTRPGTPGPLVRRTVAAHPRKDYLWLL